MYLPPFLHFALFIILQFTLLPNLLFYYIQFQNLCCIPFITSFHLRILYDSLLTQLLPLSLISFSLAGRKYYWFKFWNTPSTTSYFFLLVLIYSPNMYKTVTSTSLFLIFLKIYVVRHCRVVLQLIHLKNLLCIRYLILRLI